MQDIVFVPGQEFTILQIQKMHAETACILIGTEKPETI